MRAKNRCLCCFLFTYFCFLSWFLLVSVFAWNLFVKKDRFEIALIASITYTIEFCWLWTVKNSFKRNSVTYWTSCHAIHHFGFYYDHVIYRTPCYACGHLVNCECYGFERAFFTLRCFLLYTPSCWFQGFPGSRPCWSSKHSSSSAICLNHNNPQKSYTGRFYLKFPPGWLTKNLPLTGFELFSQQASMPEASCFILLATELHRLQ